MKKYEGKMTKYERIMKKYESFIWVLASQKFCGEGGEALRGRARGRARGQNS